MSTPDRIEAVARMEADLGTIRAKVTDMDARLLALRSDLEIGCERRNVVEKRVNRLEHELALCSSRLSEIVAHQGRQDATLERLAGVVRGTGAVSAAVPSAVVVILEALRVWGAM